MSPKPPPIRRERTIWLAALLLLLFGLGLGLYGYVRRPDAGAPAPLRSAAVPAPAVRQSPPPPADPAAARPGPSFDIVRVGPQGMAVIAGRAEGGAEITVRDGTRVLGRTRADAQGQFVFIPDAVLEPGGRELTLSARQADGTEMAGADSVFLVVPDRVPTVAGAAAEPPRAPLAVLLPRDAAPSRLLDPAAARSRRLGLDTVDYDEKGEIRFAGSARPGSPIRLYVDNRLVGDTNADADGHWTLLPTSPVAAGLHQLRVDQIGPDGRVLARVELPFQRTAAPPEAFAGGRAVVQPGQNLWRIARQTYGQGTRYTVIYLANRDQIRDPNRIYPGQIFAVPKS